MLTDRDAALRRVLDAVVAGTDVEGWAPVAADPWELGLAAFAASFRLDHAAATDYAERAVAALPTAPPSDPAATVLAYAARGLAAAGTGVNGTWCDLAPGITLTGDPIADAVPILEILQGTDDASCFARYALAEAALACGRVGVAQGIRDATGTAGFPGGVTHPFAAVMTVLAARVACFSGRVDDARALLEDLPGDGPSRLDLLVSATRSLVAGNAASPAVVRGIAQRIERGDHSRRDRLDLGCVVLCAYGLTAIGDTHRATDLVSGFDLTHAMVIDRALALELIVAGAERYGEPAAAQAGLVSAEELDGDPIADSTLDRIRSRVALVSGRPDLALPFAEQAVVRAEAEGRAIEAAEGRIIWARARVAAGDRGAAARHLEVPVAEADSAGHRAFRRAAGRELHGTGRRLRPLAGSGAAGLSAREREVLALMLEGYENSEIAARLHISPHTARAHVSRVLAAHEAPTRGALAAQLADSTRGGASPAAAQLALSELTVRQRAVVAEVVTGARNAQIADRLGITVRTVEKHLNDVMRRWRVSGRVELVMRVAGHHPVDRDK